MYSTPKAKAAYLKRPPRSTLPPEEKQSPTDHETFKTTLIWRIHANCCKNDHKVNPKLNNNKSHHKTSTTKRAIAASLRA
jgi:hypothetical protein